MYQIRNLTNSPHNIHLAGGKKGRLAARGIDSFDVDPKMLPYFQRCGFLVVEAAKKTPNKPQLDHDGDGHPGGSLPASERDVDDIRAQYEELFGESPDRRWGAHRLQSEIDKKLAD